MLHRCGPGVYLAQKRPIALAPDVTKGSHLQVDIVTAYTVSNPVCPRFETERHLKLEGLSRSDCITVTLNLQFSTLPPVSSAPVEFKTFDLTVRASTPSGADCTRILLAGVSRFLLWVTSSAVLLTTHLHPIN